MKTLIKTFQCETELNEFIREKKTFIGEINLNREVIDIKVNIDVQCNICFTLIYKTNEED